MAIKTINQKGADIDTSKWFAMSGNRQAARKAKPMEEPLEQLANVLDQESYEWLTANNADVADAVEGAVRKGSKPDAIRRFVMRHTGRYEFALRCEAAARYLQRQQ